MDRYNFTYLDTNAPPLLNSSMQPQQSSASIATTVTPLLPSHHFYIIQDTQQTTQLYQEHLVLPSFLNALPNNNRIQAPLATINPPTTQQLQPPRPTTQSYQQVQEVSELVPLDHTKICPTLIGEASPENDTANTFGSETNEKQQCSPAIIPIADKRPINMEYASLVAELFSTENELENNSAENNATENKEAEKYILRTKKGPGRPAIKRQRLSPTCSIKPSTVTLPNGRIKCLECDQDFSNPCYVTQHNNRHHSGERPYHCAKCGKCFKILEKYEVHVSRHEATEKPHKCSQCPKQFYHKSDLKRHFSTTHTDDKKHVCELCSKNFSRNDHLQKHIKTHNKPKRKPKKMIVKNVVGQEIAQKVAVNTQSNELNANDGIVNKDNTNESKDECNDLKLDNSAEMSFDLSLFDNEFFNYPDNLPIEADMLEEVLAILKE